MQENFHRKKHLTSFQMIILGFAGVILLGTLLLMLPVSSADGIVTPFDEALFTSTSAVQHYAERNIGTAGRRNCPVDKIHTERNFFG